MPSQRPSSSSSRASASGAGNGGIVETLDYKPGGRPLLHPADASQSSSNRPSEEHDRNSLAGSFFSDVAEGIRDQDREKMRREVVRYTSFAWAILNCLGAGGITAYSLYAPLFQKKLHYSQLQVNGVSITAELALYLPVPLFGYLADRYGPRVPSLLAGFFFGIGYLLAAFTYKSGPPPSGGGDGWPYWAMILAFIPIGCGTSCMYLSGVTTCAKNFGRGRFKGIALALPIACFGLSGMWQAQVGSNLLSETKPNGSKGDVDVYRYFLFLGIMLLVMGIIGFFMLNVVGEDAYIDEAVDELERSGWLDESEFFHRSLVAENDHADYGTLGDNADNNETASMRRRDEEEKARKLEEHRKKTWLLNEETRRFLSDGTMWWLAAGFFLVTGPGEAFINNLGTIIGTLYPSSMPEDDMTSAATHVSIVAVTSTVARILTGTLTDILAPTSDPHQHRRGPNSLANSMASLTDPILPPVGSHGRRWQVSRITFLLTFSALMSLGQILLASGALQSHGDKFWLISGSIGLGYGAVFSLVPICISVIWGVENFGTNWGIVATFPALGATIWGLVYSGVYQWAAEREETTMLVDGETAKVDVLCHGAMCYAPTFWGMAISVWIACGLWMWAWRGPGGWVRRGILI